MPTNSLLGSSSLPAVTILAPSENVTSLINEWISGDNTEFTVALTGKIDPSTGNGFHHSFSNNTEKTGATFLTLDAVPEPSAVLFSTLTLFAGLTRRSRA